MNRSNRRNAQRREAQVQASIQRRRTHVQATTPAPRSNPAEVPTLPEPDIVQVPNRLPRRLQQALLDIAFLAADLMDSRQDTTKTRNEVEGALLAWKLAHINWDKSHINQLPIVQQYVYERNNVLASWLVMSRAYEKLAKFFCSARGSPLLTSELALGLQLGGATFQEAKATYAASMAQHYKVFPSVEEMMEQMDRNGGLLDGVS